jgi:demethylmenaquinone methyltransferase / 2-methoxy-6-polyprenyl-1,4-benzoquinol methylase
MPSGAQRAVMVREMFDRIAGRYDLMNTVMTAGLNRLWNKKVVGATGLGPGGRVLDLACGTGSLTHDLAKKVGPEGYVLGVDFSREMLRAARPEPNVEYRLGDATDLEGVSSGAFDAATIAYGARNIPDLDALFSEMARTLRPGGIAVCLEIARPEGRLSSAFYGVWFDRIVPGLGGLVSGDPSAYSYLPESVKEFVAPRELADIIERNGLQDVTWERVAGIITLHRGIKRGDAG